MQHMTPNEMKIIRAVSWASLFCGFAGRTHGPLRAASASVPEQAKAPPYPKAWWRPVVRRLNQAKITAVFRRVRNAPPIKPKPPSIIAQDAGSGTGSVVAVIVTVFVTNPVLIPVCV